MRRLLSAAAVLGLLALAPVSSADPTGQTTLDETIRAGAGTGYAPLTEGPGEPYVVRKGGSAKAPAKRARQRRSLAFFAQLTDPQIVDEMSPARVDFVDPAGGALKSSHRPQEALRRRRSTRSSATSTPTGAARGRRARQARDPGFAITTGDLADNQQLNETRWFRTVLDGGRVDPFSGKPAADGQCSQDPAVTARINDDVANRRYTGIQDYDDYRGIRDDLYGGYWDPDEAAAAGGLYAAFPRYPGLLDAAQAPFDAAGLDIPWYVSRGNHDGLIQGNAPAEHRPVPLDRGRLPQGLPDAAGRPRRVQGSNESALFRAQRSGVHLVAAAGARTVPPDPDREIVSETRYRG